ncbi:hypothetical protein [Natronobiforma cellulositropha]|uniref:hypothetical protein n=1 Tax=Natronobiforma cellulositropha TaxID=1679076 RepID=UPI0021D59432|nr:hypothetical protein [Natronobiforma cellulositropha]
MNVRDALEADADALAAIAGSPTDVMRNLVHDRTVRVAEENAPDENASVSVDESKFDGSDPDDLLGFVSFDASGGTVHVTQLNGTADACERLLDEPIRFAECESMAVEVLAPRDDDAVSHAIGRFDFDEQGLGPRFDGERTVRFRLEPEE